MPRVAALIAALALVLIACGAEEPPTGPIDGHPSTLVGTSWAVTTINGVATPRDASPTMTFAAGQVQGSGPCNHYGGSYDYDPRTGELRFRDLGMTAMACAEPERNQVETAFIRAIGQPVLVAATEPGGRLVLTGSAGGRLELVVVGPAVTD